MILKKLLFVKLFIIIFFNPAFCHWAEGDEEIKTLIFKGTSFYTAGGIEVKKNETLNFETPMGSLWKLFVFAYLKEENISTGDYFCKGQHLKEEAFCCQNGGQIGAEEALAKSCGLFFQKYLEEIPTAKWKKFWRKKDLYFDWLLLTPFKPETRVKVSELLFLLDKIKSFSSFLEIKKTLIQTLVKGTLKNSFYQFGSQLFVKTFTWSDDFLKDQKNNFILNSPARNFIGGFAGWTASDDPIWVYANGTSKKVAQKFSTIFQDGFSQKETNQTVLVDLLDNYPIKRIYQLPTKIPAKSGILNGDYQIEFKNSNKFEFYTQNSIELLEKNNKLKSKLTTLNLKGIFSLENYVARVIEREGTATDYKEALKAFSIIVRTYLFQNALKNNNTYLIKDSTRYQRVSLSNPNPDLLKVAQFTSGLYLQGELVQYRDESTIMSKISWERIIELAKADKTFPEILKSLFPNSKLDYFIDKRSNDCRPGLRAHQYLSYQIPKWRKVLKSMKGYEEIQNYKICHLDYSKPYSDIRKNIIYSFYDSSMESKIALTHEYLHLGFKNHPLGNKENFIENLAQKLSGASNEKW